MAVTSIHLPQGAALWSVASYGDQRHPPGRTWWNVNRNRQPFGMVVVQYIESGVMTLIERGQTHNVTANAAAIFAYGEDSEYGLARDATTTCKTRWVLLEGAGLLEHANAMRSQFGSVFRFERDHSIVSVMRELTRQANPRRGRDVLLIATHVHRLIMRLFEFGMRTRYASQSPVERAIDQMLRDPLSAASMKELAQQHDISREHLTRVFGEKVGRSPAQYLAEARLAHAMSLLRETHLPISAIAQQSGYNSMHTMARQIRATTGRSPTMVRLDADRRR